MRISHLGIDGQFPGSPPLPVEGGDPQGIGGSFSWGLGQVFPASPDWEGSGWGGREGGRGACLGGKRGLREDQRLSLGRRAGGFRMKGDRPRQGISQKGCGCELRFLSCSLRADSKERTKL